LNQGPDKDVSWTQLNTVRSLDTLTITNAGFSPSDGKSHQKYRSLNLQGNCYEETIESLDYVITGKRQGC
jgi:hypothetical protein